MLRGDQNIILSWKRITRCPPSRKVEFRKRPAVVVPTTAPSVPEELGENGLVDITNDAARIHMRRTVDRLMEEDARPMAAE